MDSVRGQLFGNIVLCCHFVVTCLSNELLVINRIMKNNAPNELAENANLGLSPILNVYMSLC